jgi:hypothetical protein
MEVNLNEKVVELFEMLQFFHYKQIKQFFVENDEYY